MAYTSGPVKGPVRSLVRGPVLGVAAELAPLAAYDLTDDSDIINHAWLADYGVSGGTWSPYIGTQGLTIYNSPGTTTFNGVDTWDLDGVNQYFGTTANMGTVKAALVFARCDLTNWSSWDGLLGAVSGGAAAIGFAGNDMTQRFYPLGAFGRSIEVNSDPIDNNITVLPFGSNLAAIYGSASYQNALDLTSGLHVGRERSFARYWNGQIYGVILFDEIPSTATIQRIIAWGAYRLGFAADLHHSNEWTAAPTTYPVSSGLDLMRETAHLTRRSQRVGARSSFFVGKDSVAANEADLHTVNGIQFVGIGPPMTLQATNVLSDWTDSANVTTTNEGGDEWDEFEMVITGAATVSVSTSSHTGNRAGAFEAKLISGSLPADTECTLTNGGTPQGTAADMEGLGSSWTYFDFFLAGSSNGVEFTFPTGTSATIRVRKYRHYNDTLVRYPPMPDGSAAGASVNGDSEYCYPDWENSQELFQVCIPYGYSGSGGSGGTNTKFWSAGSSWECDNPAGPVLTGSGGSPTATATGSVVDGEPFYLVSDWDTTDIGIQEVGGTRVTASESDIPPDTLYEGSQSAVLQFVGAIATLPRPKSLSDRADLKTYIDSLIPEELFV